MSTSQELEIIKNEIEFLQHRLGGAEYLIKILIQKLPSEEITAIEKIINDNIEIYGSDSVSTDVLNESLRLLGK
ncbi:hypothetical protein J5069_03685 [Candidatus Symbiopectobacterium sp. NZEC127]|uniref:hypothetical protein n=1 Tax=Candidatus Symbiopectobacterium sp. NZEC127 TaxID=2820472 RepID=UPI00222610D1|nr:hypothetical protein [Candidatus Symbiopectobacterium sp. NZEC127]MCW2484993.1 hypothetical protein [Candidatus Symbiopectobacterium sp. NZEC127]